MNQVALITGASRGIGRGIAIELSRLGWDLVINYVANRSAADRTAGECAAVAGQSGKTIRVETCQADIGSHTDRNKLIDFTRSTFKRLDLLVNNAGVAPQIREDILNASELGIESSAQLEQRCNSSFMPHVAVCRRQRARSTSRPALGPRA